MSVLADTTSCCGAQNLIIQVTFNTGLNGLVSLGREVAIRTGKEIDGSGR
jgi:hypothetical protein